MSGPAGAGKVVGPSFASDEVPEVLEAILNTYRDQRLSGENFITTLRRVGHEPFKTAANGARHSTARSTSAEASATTA